jgi:hypothetical protein
MSQERSSYIKITPRNFKDFIDFFYKLIKDLNKKDILENYEELLEIFDQWKRIHGVKKEALPSLGTVLSSSLIERNQQHNSTLDTTIELEDSNAWDCSPDCQNDPLSFFWLLYQSDFEPLKKFLDTSKLRLDQHISILYTLRAFLQEIDGKTMGLP